MRAKSLGVAPGFGLCAWPISSIASVGTSVRERMYDASIANTTASGERHEQVARHAREKEHRHEHDADAQASTRAREPRSRPRLRESHRAGSLPMCRVPFDVLDRHRGIVDENAHREREAAERHDVDGLARARAARAATSRIDSGIDIAMMQVLRQLPRKSRIIAAVSAAAISASCTTPCTAAFTNTDWSKSAVIFRSGGSAARAPPAGRLRSVLTIESVDGAAVLQYRDQHAAMAVLAHDVGLRREAVAHWATSRR